MWTKYAKIFKAMLTFTKNNPITGQAIMMYQVAEIELPNIFLNSAQVQAKLG